MQKQKPPQQPLQNSSQQEIQQIDFDLEQKNNKYPSNFSAMSLEPSLNGGSTIKDGSNIITNSNYNNFRQLSSLKQSDYDALGSHFSQISIEQQNSQVKSKINPQIFQKEYEEFKNSNISNNSCKSFGEFVLQKTQSNQNQQQFENQDTYQEQQAWYQQQLQNQDINQQQNQQNNVNNQSNTQYPKFEDDQTDSYDIYQHINNNDTSDLEKIGNQQQQKQEIGNNQENNNQFQFQQIQQLQYQNQNFQQQQYQQQPIVNKYSQILENENESVINNNNNIGYIYEQQNQNNLQQTQRSDKVCQCNKGCKAPCGCRKRGELCIEGCGCKINNTFCNTNKDQEQQPMNKGYCGCDKNQCKTQQCECFRNQRLCNENCKNCVSIKSNCKQQSAEELEKRKNIIQNQKIQEQEQYKKQQEQQLLLQQIEQKRKQELERIKQKKEQQN